LELGSYIERRSSVPFDADAYFLGGTKSSLSLPRLHQFSYDGDASWHKPLAMAIQLVDPQLPHKMQLKHFVQVIEGNESPIVTPADNVKTLETVMAIKEAIKTRNLIKLS
jgi:predicted dehydrogenase